MQREWREVDVEEARCGSGTCGEYGSFGGGAKNTGDLSVLTLTPPTLLAMCSGDGGSDIGGELGKDGVSGRGYARRRRLRPLPEEDLNPSRDGGRGR